MSIKLLSRLVYLADRAFEQLETAELSRQVIDVKTAKNLYWNLNNEMRGRCSYPSADRVKDKWLDNIILQRYIGTEASLALEILVEKAGLDRSKDELFKKEDITTLTQTYIDQIEQGEWYPGIVGPASMLRFKPEGYTVLKAVLNYLRIKYQSL